MYILLVGTDFVVINRHIQFEGLVGVRVGPGVVDWNEDVARSLQLHQL